MERYAPECFGAWLDEEPALVSASWYLFSKWVERKRESEEENPLQPGWYMGFAGEEVDDACED